MVHDGICYIVLMMAVGGYYRGFVIERKGMVVLILCMNMVMSIKELFEISSRYGIDYIAYIQ